jgi:hypothetical protein
MVSSRDPENATLTRVRLRFLPEYADPEFREGKT